jgi:hypothetical protein
MTKWESVPDPVWLAALGIVGGEVIHLAVSSFPATDLVGIGIAAGAAVLLIRGSVAGWILAAFWAASEVSAPFVFGAPIWVGVVGLVVGLALGTKGARGYCFRDSSGIRVSGQPLPADQPHTPALVPHVAGPAEKRAGYWRNFRRRLSAVRISRKYAFFGFLIGTLVRSSWEA